MKYKGFLLATAGGVALIPAANAADLPTKAPAYVPPPAPVSWTGFYVGLHAGAAWQQSEGTYGGAPGSAGLCCGLNGNGTSFIGGAQIGYNYQIAPSWVLGVEADISGLSGNANGKTTADDDAKGNGLEARIKWLSTFRARVGYLLHPETMLYITGGGAVGKVQNTFSPNGVSSSCDQSFCAKSVSKTKWGWTVGGGIEHMLTRNWTVALEALYVNLGHTDGFNADGDKSSRFKNSAGIARLKVNYKF